MVSKKGEIFMEIKREDIPDNMINMLEIVGMENFLKIIGNVLEKNCPIWRLRI